MSKGKNKKIAQTVVQGALPLPAQNITTEEDTGMTAVEVSPDIGIIQDSEVVADPATGSGVDSEGTSPPEIEVDQTPNDTVVDGTEALQAQNEPVDNVIPAVDTVPEAPPQRRGPGRPRKNVAASTTPAVVAVVERKKPGRKPKTVVETDTPVSLDVCACASV